MNEKTILRKLHTHKVFTVDQLMAWLGCSLRTAQRYMKAWNVHTSINQNGRYHILPDIPSFDSNGLWKHRNIVFSEHGTMKQTIIHVIRQSSHGLSSDEILDHMGLPLNRSLLTHLRESAEICREKHQGRYIYFSSDAKIRSASWSSSGLLRTIRPFSYVRCASSKTTIRPSEDAVCVPRSPRKYPSFAGRFGFA